MSVGPVDEEKSGIKNSDISEYNEKIANMISSKNISNLKYYNINANFMLKNKGELLNPLFFYFNIYFHKI